MEPGVVELAQEIFRGATLAKMTLAVSMVVALSVIAEHVSPRIAVILSGYPLGAAITLFFLVLEIGVDFAAESAQYTMVGLIATQTFAFVYYKSSLRAAKGGKVAGIILSAGAGISAYFLTITLCQRLHTDLATAFLLSGFSIVDGDEDLPVNERLFNRFTIAIDVIGHELAHGVTQFEAKLTYFQQSGALNGSMSDVFGSLVKQYNLNQTADQADWIIGAGLFTSNVKGVGIRSMKAPGTAYEDPVLGKDPQPAHMKDYVHTLSDNGGVHINSGTPNYAFYVTAMELGGYAWEKAGRIWYVTLKDKLSANSKFQDCPK